MMYKCIDEVSKELLFVSKYYLDTIRNMKECPDNNLCKYMFEIGGGDSGNVFNQFYYKITKSLKIRTYFSSKAEEYLRDKHIDIKEALEESTKTGKTKLGKHFRKNGGAPLRFDHNMSGLGIRNAIINLQFDNDYNNNLLKIANTFNECAGLDLITFEENKKRGEGADLRMRQERIDASDSVMRLIYEPNWLKKVIK